MSEVQAPVNSEREITIYATRGGQMKKITTAVKTWGELQPLVSREGFDLSSLLAAENINKTDLVNDLAVLPTGNFRLFLRPKQTKSGSIDRKECFNIIKTYLEVNPQDKAKFIVDGKNMTQLTTPVLQELVARYCNISQNISENVVREVSNQHITDAERVDEAMRLLAPLSKYEAFYKVHKHLIKLIAEICMGNPLTTSEEKSIAQEAEEFLAGY